MFYCTVFFLALLFACLNEVVRYLKTFWRPLVLVLTPPLAALVFTNQEEPQAMKCAFVMIVMAVFWVTEVMPVPVTALIPVAAFPLMGVMSTVRKFVKHFSLLLLRQSNSFTFGAHPPHF